MWYVEILLNVYGGCCDDAATTENWFSKKGGTRHQSELFRKRLLGKSRRVLTARNFAVAPHQSGVDAFWEQR